MRGHEIAVFIDDQPLAYGMALVGGHYHIVGTTFI